MVSPSSGHTGNPAEPAHGDLGGASDPTVDALLVRAAQGDAAAFDQVYAMLYDELSIVARSQRARWNGNDTVSTTVLVHEAYIKLVGPAAEADAARWENRRHFFALASRVMRQVLVNYAEGQQAARRGGGERPVPLEAGALDVAAPEALFGEADEILALHQALERLSVVDERHARIVECRFFGGLSIPETAEVLGISAATVKRDWALASEWLYRELRPRP